MLKKTITKINKKKNRINRNNSFVIELWPNKITNEVHVHHCTIFFWKDCIWCQCFAIFSVNQKRKRKKENYSQFESIAAIAIQWNSKQNERNTNEKNSKKNQVPNSSLFSQINKKCPNISQWLLFNKKNFMFSSKIERLFPLASSYCGSWTEFHAMKCRYILFFLLKNSTFFFRLNAMREPPTRN